MIIVIDTNVLIEDRHLSKTGFRVLFDGLGKGLHRLCIPEIVLDEAVNDFREGLHEELNKIKPALQRLARLSQTSHAPPLTEADVDKLTSNYRNTLKGRLQHAGASWLPYPKTSHAAIAQRALNRRKPFDAQGHNGYRDTLLWETILEFANAPTPSDIAFISRNTGDFSEKDKGILHSHLIEDLVTANLPADRVKFFDGLDSFVSAHITPGLKKLKDVEAQLAANDFPAFSLKSWLNTSLLSLLRTETAPPDLRDLGLPRGFNVPHIENISDIELTDTPAVRLLSEKEYLAEFEVSFSAKISGFIFRGTYTPIALIWSRLSVSDSQPDEVHIPASFVAHAGAHIEMTFDTAGVVTSTTLQGTWRTDIDDSDEGDDDDYGDYDGDDDRRGHDGY